MSTNIERRITEALAARAELVDTASNAAERPGLTISPAPTRSRSAARRWRAPVAAAAVLVAITVLATSVLGGRTTVDRAAAAPTTSADPTRTAADTNLGTATPGGASSPTAVPVPKSPHDLLTVPTSPTVGVAYPFDLLTHCGVVGADVGGVYFAAEQPLTDGPGGRPAGWANPFQRGTMTLLSPTEAQFTDTAGHTARFHVDPNTKPPVPCD